jgi:hypothetical protein
VSAVRFGDYFSEWIETYQGRTSRGFSETSRALYKGAIVANALPTWRSWKLSEVEPAAEDGIVASNPIRGVRIPNDETESDEVKRAKGLTDDERACCSQPSPTTGGSSSSSWPSPACGSARRLD